MLLANLVLTVFGLVFPAAPKWVGALVAQVLPFIIELVHDLMDDTDMSGAEKFEDVLDGVKDHLDVAFDDIPEWRDLDEDKRDLIIGGLIELAVFIEHVSAKDAKGSGHALRHLRKQLKRAAK